MLKFTEYITNSNILMLYTKDSFSIVLSKEKMYHGFQNQYIHHSKIEMDLSLLTDFSFIYDNEKRTVYSKNVNELNTI